MSIVNADADLLLQTVKNLQTAISSIEATKSSITTKYQHLASYWNDKKYTELGEVVLDCTKSLNSILKTLLQGQKYVALLAKNIQEYEATNIDGVGGLSGGRTRHLSQSEANSRYQSGVSSINEQIENYRQALLDRGIPEGYWLTSTLARHKASMVEQLGYDIDVARGCGQSSVHNREAYQYPVDYTQFYNDLAERFKAFCLSENNPNYNENLVDEWFVNCQRCVPTYEMQRRGQDVTAQPCIGEDYIAANPFSVWQEPEVINCFGVGNDEIETVMREWGDGARAQVVVMWTPFEGHTFIAEQINGRTHYIDPQSANADYADWVDSALPGYTQFCRIDNLQTSPLIENCYREVHR